MAKNPSIIRPWLKKTGHTSEWLAGQIGISRDSMTRYARQTRKIPRPVAIAIETVTQGGVTLKDWGLE